jgi:DNA invertase Pin-like site-specific DNA recombinase
MADRAVAYYRLPRRLDPAAPLSSQARVVARFARERGWVLIEPFVERTLQGRARPELARALARCRASGAALLVPELAPLGRDPQFLDAVLAARVRLVATDTPRVGRRALTLLRRVANRARDDASTRSRDALRAARRRGVHLGSPRPELGSRAGVAALRASADARAREIAPAIEEIRHSNPGASLRAIARVLDALGVPTARGGRWGPSGVRNALRRLE